MSDYKFEMFTTSTARIWKSLQKLKTKAMAPFGLRSRHVMCLFFLQQSEEGLTASEISDLSELDKGAVSRAVAELEQQGYVHSCKPGEKRKYRTKIALTAEGLAICEKMNLVIREAVLKAGCGMTDEERETFDRGLALIAANLQAMADEGAHSPAGE